jgi:hypothetical protein
MEKLADAALAKLISKALLTGLALSGGAAIANEAAGLARGVANSSVNQAKFQRALDIAVKQHPVLQNAAETNPEKLASFSATIFRYAPNVASDPNLLGSILSNAIHGQSIDPMTVRSLLEMEEKFQRNHQSVPIFEKPPFPKIDIS